MIAYLSGAMQYADDEGEGWRKNITEWLTSNLDHSVINPVEESRLIISNKDSHDYRNVPGKSRIGVVAEELSQKAIFSELKKRMTFASSSIIKLFASALVGYKQYPMGSHIPTSE